MMVRIDKKLYDQALQYKNDYEPDLSLTKAINRLLRMALAAAEKK
jgi:hypothetical protein